MSNEPRDLGIPVGHSIPGWDMSWAAPEDEYEWVTFEVTVWEKCMIVAARAGNPPAVIAAELGTSVNAVKTTLSKLRAMGVDIPRYLPPGMTKEQGRLLAEANKRKKSPSHPEGHEGLQAQTTPDQGTSSCKRRLKAPGKSASQSPW